jgi:hypothetical protein
VADLPRLRFRFDRRSLGRLRMLIDTINGPVAAPATPTPPRAAGRGNNPK